MTQIGLNVELDTLIDEGSSQPFMYNKDKSGYLSKPYINYPIHQQIQIQKARLQFLKNCRILKRPPTSLRIKGASSIELPQKAALFQTLENKMLSIAINTKQNIIKSLTSTSVKMRTPLPSIYQQRKPMTWINIFRRNSLFCTNKT